MVQMTNPLYTTVRLKFKKVGDLQYISHLDLVRTMQKVLTRAGLKLWYTEGFNPKPKMIFAAPLSVGIESECELLDIRLTEVPPMSEIVDSINKKLGEGMKILDAYIPERPFTDLAWLSYTVEIKTNGASDVLAQKIEALLNAESLNVLKNTKKGEALVDIRPLIKSAYATYSDGLIILNTILSANPQAFLNPDNVIKALREKLGILSSAVLTEEYYTVMRNRAYSSDMTEFK